ELGDLRKGLPACRYRCKDAQSDVRGASSYLVVIAFVLSPFAILTLDMLARFVFRKFNEVLRGMEGSGFTLFAFLQESLRWLILAQLCIFTGLLIAAILYVGGPRVARSLQFRPFPFVDWIAWHVPWKRKRMQRNF